MAKLNSCVKHGENNCSTRAEKEHPSQFTSHLFELRGEMDSVSPRPLSRDLDSDRKVSKSIRQLSKWFHAKTVPSAAAFILHLKIGCLIKSVISPPSVGGD
jgi:hypothetical protein